MQNKTHSVPELTPERRQAITQATAAFPCGTWILTAAYEGRRLGHVVHQAFMVCKAPPTVCVAVPKGTPIMALISESHKFGLVLVPEGDPAALVRRFNAGARNGSEPEDMFLGMPLTKCALPHLPIPQGGLSWIACDLMMHMDMEGDSDLFTGRVVDGQASPAGGAPLLWHGDKGKH